VHIDLYLLQIGFFARQKRIFVLFKNVGADQQDG